MKQRPVTDEFRNKCHIAALGNNRGAGNKNMFWITDGTNNFKLHEGAEYDTQKFKEGRTISKETLAKYKESYLNRVYVNKDGKDLYINKSDLEIYLQNGYNLGRAKESYVNRGSAISAGKKGKIKVQNSSGKVKYIDKELIELYKEQGFIPTSKH